VLGGKGCGEEVGLKVGLIVSLRRFKRVVRIERF
jgi:hypothetical protein